MSVFTLFYAVRKGAEFVGGYCDKQEKSLSQAGNSVLNSVTSTVRSIGQEEMKKMLWDSDTTPLTEKQLKQLNKAPYIEKALSRGLEKMDLTNGHLVDLQVCKVILKLGQIVSKMTGFPGLAKVCQIAKKTLRIYLKTEPLRAGKLAILKNCDLTTNEGQLSLIEDALVLITVAYIGEMVLYYSGVISADTLDFANIVVKRGRKLRKIWMIGNAVKLFEKIENNEESKKSDKMAFTVAKNILKNVGMDLKALKIMPKAQEGLSLVPYAMGCIEKTAFQ